MARGKNAAKRKNRQTAQAQATLAALRADLAAEQALLAEVSAQAQAVEQAKAELREETAGRDRDTADELAALRAQADDLVAAVNLERAHRDACDDTWSKIVDKTVGQLGGGREGFEKFFRLIGGDGYLTDNPNRRETGQQVRLQKIRGERHTLPDIANQSDPSVADSLAGMYRRRLYEPRERVGADIEPFDRDNATPEQVDAYDQVEAAVQKVFDSKPSTRTADALHAWHPLPLLAGAPYAISALLTDLGAIDYLSTPAATIVADEQWPAPSAALSATVRNRLASTNIDTLTDQWRAQLTAGETLNRVLGKHHGPLHGGPLHPRPGRAASLRHLYTKSALGTWSKAEENDGSTYLWGLLSVAMTCATAFWMPAGQTVSFADSDPISDDDRPDLLLPFPQVFMAFAEPLEVGPGATPTNDQVAILRGFDAVLNPLRDKNADPSLKDLLFSADIDHLGQLPVTDAIDVRGGRIEGVLMLADSLGRLDDTFAWCVSVPSGPAGTLGRYVIPASLDACEYRSLVENLVAVASWADWHAPDHATALPAGLSADDIADLTGSASFRRDADRSGAGGVRVLNVRSSVNAPTDTSASTGRHVAPHVRRGHWRRQRHGPGREQVRRIRIAPLIVNAHRGQAGHRVYVLPRRERPASQPD